jgi:polysaccharide export outer membrane protein
VFMARDFVIRDGDTVYVTEAPFAQWSKILNAIVGTAGGLQTISAIGNSIGF